MDKSLNWREYIITRLIKASGYSAILFVGLIFLFLIKEGVPALGEISLSDLLATRWYPIEDFFGILPLLTGSLIVTIGAALIAIPFGLGSAIFIAEIAPRWLREILKPLVELLGGLPSVVLGFLGILVLSPNLRILLDLPTGLTALAVGATRWQTIWRVTLPAAKSGVLTAIMLGIGRALGETMTVMMVTGNAPVMATKWNSIFQPVRTMTATIAAEMGEVANGSSHYHVLFLIGLILFLFSLAINVAASSVVFRQKKRAERILS